MFLLVALGAEWADVGFLSAVHQQVFLQVILGDKGLPAQVAAEGTLLPTEAEVGLQATSGAEALIAEVAAEQLQINGEVKLFLADSTETLQVGDMTFHVFHQIRFETETFPTADAAPSLLRWNPLLWAEALPCIHLL